MPDQLSPTKAELAADHALAEIDKQFNVVQLLTPTNLHVEQKKVISGEVKNPVFAYRKPRVDYKKLIAQLETLEIPNTPVGHLLDKKRQETANKVRMLDAIGTDRFTELSKKIYGVPDKEIIKDAHELMKTSNPLQPKSDYKQPYLSSKVVAENLRDILKQYGLTDWKVEMTADIISGVIVRSSRKTVYVHANTVLAVTRLGPIITHEIETHVLTTHNGAQQPLQLLSLGMAGFTRTQEGLASYNVESQHPELFHRPARFWSRNALGVELALKGSFWDVYQYMLELGFKEHFAFGVAAKVKRGLIVTAEPGGFTKDYVYLAGRRDIANFVATGGDVRDLYVGKINLDDLGELKKLPWLKTPAVLPMFLTGQVTGPMRKSALPPPQ